jgi:hypothetical protein
MPDCTTCRWHNDQTRRCGAYEMPAEIARARPMLCGDAGADHVLRSAVFNYKLEAFLICVLIVIGSLIIYLSHNPIGAT